MSNASETQVLIAGAGPIGATAAIELARRGITCRIVEPTLQPPQYAKAVGVQPRTLEVFEGVGIGADGLAAPGVDQDELVTHMRATFAAEAGVPG